MSSEIKVNTISEYTSANGVVIDGVTLKDSKIGGTITIPGSTGTMALTSDITGGLEELDMWHMTANLTSNADPITANLARSAFSLQTLPKGTGMSVSSGIWTFPSTGFYHIHWYGWMQFQQNSNVGNAYIYASTDNFSSNEERVAFKQMRGGNGSFDGFSIATIIKVTDTSNHKIKFRWYANLPFTLYGSTTENSQSFVFMKVGEV